jgi:hypothetical protein
LPSSPNPFSQIWEKGSQNFKVPLPCLGEGFRVRAKTTVLNLDEVYVSKIHPVFEDFSVSPDKI